MTNPSNQDTQESTVQLPATETQEAPVVVLPEVERPPLYKLLRMYSRTKRHKPSLSDLPMGSALVKLDVDEEGNVLAHVCVTDHVPAGHYEVLVDLTTGDRVGRKPQKHPDPRND